MSEADPRTDLGIILIATAGAKDSVYLAHNGMLAFTVRCEAGKETRVKIAPKFFTFPNEQWEQVFETYIRWKRLHLPPMKWPKYTGLKKDATPHPWRRKLKTKAIPPSADELFPEATEPLPPPDIMGD